MAVPEVAVYRPDGKEKGMREDEGIFRKQAVGIYYLHIHIHTKNELWTHCSSRVKMLHLCALCHI